MPIQFHCSECGVGYEVDDGLAGKAILCRQCQKRGQVPAAPAAPAAPTRPMVSFACPSCGKRANIPASVIGQQVRCLGCNNMTTVSGAAVTAAAPEPVAKPAPSIQVAAQPSRRNFLTYGVLGGLALFSAGTGAFLARWRMPRSWRRSEDSPDGPPPEWRGRGRGKGKDGEKDKGKDKGKDGGKDKGGQGAV